MTNAGVTAGPALLDISTFDEALTLPCRIRHAREVWGRATLHLQFGSLSDAQHDALENLIGEVARASSNVTHLRPTRVNRRPQPRQAG